MLMPSGMISIIFGLNNLDSERNTMDLEFPLGSDSDLSSLTLAVWNLRREALLPSSHRSNYLGRLMEVIRLYGPHSAPIETTFTEACSLSCL